MKMSNEIAEINLDLDHLNWNFERDPDEQLLSDFKQGVLKECFKSDFIKFILGTEFLLFCQESFMCQDLLTNNFIPFPKDEFLKMKNTVLMNKVEDEIASNYYTNCFVRDGIFIHPESGEILDQNTCKPCCVHFKKHQISVFILDKNDADYFINP